MPYYLRFMGCLCLFFLVTGCKFNQQDPSALTGPATHVGTGVVLRVDSARAEDDKVRFVPVLHKGDVSGLLPQQTEGNSKQDDEKEKIRKREILNDDLIQISLRSAFIRYLKEVGKNRKGEIVILVSFHSGSEVRDKGFVVYSSTGQTLSSSLNIGEWPIIGPIRIDSDNFLMRVVVLEVDSEENKQISEALNMATNVADTAAGSNPLVKQVAQESLDLLITMNTDDIVLDERFGLRRKQDEGWDYNHTPLLTGTYIILQQEDRLQGSDVVDNANSATYPPNIDRMFFDTHSKNLYRAYHYTGNAPIDNTFSSQKDYYQIEMFSGSPDNKWDIDKILAFKDKEELLKELFQGLTVEQETKEKILNLVNNYPESAEKIEDKIKIKRLLQQILDTAKMKARSRQFGYPEGYEPIGNNVSGGYADAMLDICKEAYRGSEKNDDTCNKKEALKFEFPVVVAPKANMALVQYPIHTHIILSIERVSGVYQTKYHDLYKAYDDYLESYFKPLLKESDFKNIATTVTNMKTAEGQINECFEKVESEEKLAPKVTHLKNVLIDLEDTFSGPKNPVVRPVYMKLYRLTGEWYKTAESIKPKDYEEFNFDTELDKIGNTSTSTALRPLLNAVQEKDQQGIPVTAALTQISKKIGSKAFETPEDFEKYLKDKYIDEQLSNSDNKDEDSVAIVDYFVRLVEKADKQYPVTIDMDNHIETINERITGYIIVTVSDAKKWVQENHEKSRQLELNKKPLEKMAEIRANIRGIIEIISAYEVKASENSSQEKVGNLLRSAKAKEVELNTITDLQKGQKLEQEVRDLQQEAHNLVFPPKKEDSDAN